MSGLYTVNNTCSPKACPSIDRASLLAIAFAKIADASPTQL